MTDDTTTARRTLLELILRAVEEDSPTLAERGLLRPLVEAEIAHGQTVIDQFTADSPWLKAAAEDHAALQQRHQDLIAETRRQGDVHQRTGQRAAQAAAVIERVREVARRWDRDAPPPGNQPLTELLAALDGPAAAPIEEPTK